MSMPSDSGKALRPLSLKELRELDLPRREWVVQDLLPRGSLTLLTAREKAGKSLLALDLCAAVATGDPFLGRAVRSGPTVLVPVEEHLRDVRQRTEVRLGDRDASPFYVL